MENLWEVSCEGDKWFKCKEYKKDLTREKWKNFSWVLGESWCLGISRDALDDFYKAANDVLKDTHRTHIRKHSSFSKISPFCTKTYCKVEKKTNLASWTVPGVGFYIIFVSGRNEDNTSICILEEADRCGGHPWQPQQTASAHSCSRGWERHLSPSFSTCRAVVASSYNCSFYMGALWVGLPLFSGKNIEK